MKPIVVASLISAALGGAFVGAVLRVPSSRFAYAQPPATTDLRLAEDDAWLTPDERVNVAVYDKTNRSVVNITTSLAANESFFFVEPAAKGAGSGWVHDASGHILTNYHVVEDAEEVTVTLHDGSQYEAAIVGVDKVNDIAVIKIDAPRSLLIPLATGESERLRVGQKVFAIGNPFGWERTMSQGMISSLNRTLPGRSQRSMKSIIQIDGSLNKGNSGGPLLDTRGRVVGMNVAIASKSGDSAGIGFAIPANTLRRIVPQLIREGRVRRPHHGILALAPRNGRLVVALVEPDGPAARAGLQGYRLLRKTYRRGPFLYEEKAWDRENADEIASVDGQSVRSLDDFLTAIDKHRPGETAVLTVIRKGERLRIPIRLGEERQ